MFSPKVLDRQTQLLRCSLRGATSTTRPWVQGLRHVEVVAGYRSNPAALRSSAPQRRSAARPPTALPAPPSDSRSSATSRLAAARCVVASCAVGSRRGAGGWRLRRLCGAEQRSAAGAVRRAAPDRREVSMGRPRSGAGAGGIAAAPRSGGGGRSATAPASCCRPERAGLRPARRRAVRASRGPPQRSRKRRPPAPLRAPAHEQRQAR